MFVKYIHLSAKCKQLEQSIALTSVPFENTILVPTAWKYLGSHWKSNQRAHRHHGLRRFALVCSVCC